MIRKRYRTGGAGFRHVSTRKKRRNKLSNYELSCFRPSFLPQISPWVRSKDSVMKAKTRLLRLSVHTRPYLYFKAGASKSATSVVSAPHFFIVSFCNWRKQWVFFAFAVGILKTCERTVDVVTEQPRNGRQVTNGLCPNRSGAMMPFIKSANGAVDCAWNPVPVLGILFFI